MHKLNYFTNMVQDHINNKYPKVKHPASCKQEKMPRMYQKPVQSTTRNDVRPNVRMVTVES